MKRWAVTPALALVIVAGVAGCGGSKSGNSTATTIVATSAGEGTAFCGFWATLAKDTSATTTAQLLQIVKNNAGLVADLTGSIPTGAISPVATNYLTTVEAAAEQNNATLLTATVRNQRGQLDSYCGVSSAGTALPASQIGAGAQSTGAGKQTAFCGYWATLDKETYTVTSASASLQVIRNNPGLIANLTGSIPTGAINALATNFLTTVEAAAEQNNPSALTPSLFSQGIELDTYCGVDGTGTALPADFGAGSGKAACTNFLAVNNAIMNATTSSAIVSGIRSHATQLSNFTSETSQLPGNLANEGKALADIANQVKATGNGSLIMNPPATISNDANDLQLYCGQNT